MLPTRWSTDPVSTPLALLYPPLPPQPSWYGKFNSPYYSESHVAFRAKVRAFVETEIMPHTHEWDEKKSLPLELYKKTYEAGILPGVVGAPWAGGLGHKLSIPSPQNFDYFHELIILDEFGRCGSGGVLWGLLEGVHIGLPPVLNFGSEDLRERVGLRVLKGEGTICLCITEPYAGSDVANIRCTAKKTACGKFYTVSGEKKWITNGVWADFFTVAVRTGGPGMGGISLLVIEKTMPGVECKRMDCMGVWASGTTYVTFDEVKVPVANLIGNENSGFKYIMHNFNHERWGFVVQANRFARVCYEEAFLYAHKRRTFGKRLIEHPVIRAKLADMIRQIDATHNQMENITYQWADFFTVAVRTGGPGMGGISLLVIEKTMPGVECKRMDCMGVWASGTTYVTFDEVKVPVANLIGNENSGFKYIMHNFNHERWGFVVQANRFARVCYEEAFLYAHKRRTFGKRLIEHPVIRAKLADMIRQIDATHNQMENITYQMCTMTREESAKALAGITALAKVQSTKVFEYCAREAAQIFGGASYVRGGQGEKVERLYRDVRAYAIPGGSEEIMMDLGVRQAMKEWENVQSKM